MTDSGQARSVFSGYHNTFAQQISTFDSIREFDRFSAGQIILVTVEPQPQVRCLLSILAALPLLSTWLTLLNARDNLKA
jgi:hypothetical protein